MAKKADQAGALADRLRRAIEASGLSLSQLGRQANVDHSRLSRFVRGERDLTLDAVDRLCQVLGLRFEEPDQAEASNPADKPTPEPPAADKPTARKGGRAKADKPAPRKLRGKKE